MLDFSDLPYRYFPPRHSPLIACVIRWYNRLRHLPRVLRVMSIQVSGIEALAAQRRRGDRLMLLPNHPTHTDAAIMLEAANRASIKPQFMAAYDLFLRSRRSAFVMQSLGSFSVDREGSDQRAMKQAMGSLTRGRRALTIFPEGNVYLENDRVTPFHDGAAFLAIRTVKAISSPQRVLVVPIAIKVTYVTDIRPALTRLLNRIAQTLGGDLDKAISPLVALRKLGEIALRRNLKNRGIAFGNHDDLPALIKHAAECVLEPLEVKLELAPRSSDSLMDRVRGARRLIHEVRTDPQRVADHASAATWADEAMLVLRILSYSGRYVAESPTIDRIAETVEKLSEDLHRQSLPPIGPRRALVHLCTPLVANEYLRKGHRTRDAVRTLTSDCESAVQHGIDQLNHSNTAFGSKLWDTALA